MALVEFVPEKEIVCDGCGKHIAVGKIAYRDDEMEGSFWCKQCYDEVVAEVMAEDDEPLYDEHLNESGRLASAPAAALAQPMRPSAPAAALAQPMRPSAPAAALAQPVRPSAPAAALAQPMRPAAPAAAPAQPMRPFAPAAAPAQPMRPSAPAAAPAQPMRPSAPAAAPAQPMRPSAPAAAPSERYAAVDSKSASAAQESHSAGYRAPYQAVSAASSSRTEQGGSEASSLGTTSGSHSDTYRLADLVKNEDKDDDDSTYRIGRKRVSEEELSSYPPLGVEPVSLHSDTSAEETKNYVEKAGEVEEASDVSSESQADKYTSGSKAYTAPSGISGGLQDLWSRYHNYMAENLSADMVEGLADISSRDWTCIGSDMETVISQGASKLDLGPETDQLLARLGDDQTLEYGWPLVVVETNEGMSVAPLLVVNISQPPYDDYSAKVISEPVINPAVLRAIWAHSSDVNFLRSSFGDGVPHGALAISRYVQQICETMGLQTFELDPLKLIRELPADPGVYNMAVLMLTKPTAVAKRNSDELREVAQKDDWQSSSSSCLFGIKLDDIEGHQTMPVMPWSAEPVFEDSLQLIRTKALTVFTMAQRDIIDQLIASACANAWIDNESILVLSDDDKRLDEVVNLAGDVHSALLVRTCVSRDLAMNPKRKATSLSDLAGILLNEVQAASSSIRQIIGRAYKDLEKVEEIRKEALKGASFRKTWSDKKIRWESKRLEISKRIWQHGLYPQGTDPKEIGVEAQDLVKAVMFKGMRSSMFLKKIGAKSGATIEDVVEWANISLHIKNAEAEIAKVNDPDKYNIGAANYRWAASCIGAVSARVSGALTGCANILERLAECTERDEDTKSIVTELVPHLKAWASNYYDADEFFELQPCMFDTVIFDNANQINLAWALPWAYRAKRLVIIGNPNGIPPNVFVDGAQLNRAAVQYHFDRQDLINRGLEYGATSVFNAFSMA